MNETLFAPKLVPKSSTESSFPDIVCRFFWSVWRASRDGLFQSADYIMTEIQHLFLDYFQYMYQVMKCLCAGPSMILLKADHGYGLLNVTAQSTSKVNRDYFPIHIGS